MPAEQQQGRRGAHGSQRHRGGHQGGEHTQAHRFARLRPAPLDRHGKERLASRKQKKNPLQGNRQNRTNGTACQRQTPDLQQIDDQDLAPSAA
jgi:hypothetical protein